MTLIKFEKAKITFDTMLDDAAGCREEYKADGAVWINPDKVEQVQDHTIIFSHHYVRVVEDLSHILAKIQR